MIQLPIIENLQLHLPDIILQYQYLFLVEVLHLPPPNKDDLAFVTRVLRQVYDAGRTRGNYEAEGR